MCKKSLTAAPIAAAFAIPAAVAPVLVTGSRGKVPCATGSCAAD